MTNHLAVPEMKPVAAEVTASSAEDAGATRYRYKVIDRCFKENLLMVPPQLFVTGQVYNSRGLEPADEVTKQATEKLKKEHAAFYKTTPGDAFAIVQENADLKAQLAEAIAALKAAAKK
jgi:hypothetical protein